MPGGGAPLHRRRVPRTIPDQRKARPMTAPGDVTSNYTQLMRERGMTWDDLADEFERQAVGPPRPLDGGVNARNMARWARSHSEAAQQRQASLAPAPATDGEDTSVWDDAAARAAAAAQQRRDAAADPNSPEPRPDDAAPDAPPRKAVPPRKRTA